MTTKPEESKQEELQIEESNFILVQFFFTDPTSEQPRIHPKKIEKRQGALNKELSILIQEYEELDAGIDLVPYREAVQRLRKIKGKEAYQEFVDELIRPYL